MNPRHYCLITLLALSACLQAAPQPEPGETRKLLVKPPLPGVDPDLPLLPAPIKQSPVVEPAPMPRLNDSNKSFDIIMVAAAEGAKPAEGRIAVGFFNHGDRDVTLEIDKRLVKLNSRHYVQLKLPREFAWRENDRPMQTTKIPDDADGVEIVFRR